VVGYYVGNRIGELRQVRWDQVDLLAGEIHLAKRQTKGKAARTLPAYGEMKHWLAIQKQERDEKWPDCPRVFHYLGRPIGSHIKGWKEACERAGVPALLFHDLRRSAVRNMERAGFPRKLAMSISGHKTEAIYRRYDIVSPEDLKIARTKTESYLEQRHSEVTSGHNPVATQLPATPRHLN
jgi:integrase